MGEHVDARSDLFTLGVIFYELLTGDMPYKAETVQKAMFKRTRESPNPRSRLIRVFRNFSAMWRRNVCSSMYRCGIRAQTRCARNLESWHGGSSTKH